ncbi:hypothetical protein CLNEO_22670 [Anaerotignum neopropionicum]|uniref:Uncharacterized protein n=1 Tax=Anaerotignum neopropionicum TaxID=36847 RepID=A0A136WCU5_9FIRM|nr:hypothetical protein [Anaerotignum neopropionicum]KXL52333.1 hypothetical protein CLNEO_22670 [Anaerotignum neopropionicum]
MKKRKYVIALMVIGFIFLWNQEPPEGTGMTNRFIGTYVCETNPFYYITAYDDGIFYYYCEREGLYCKGNFREFAEHTYELAGKKINPQRIFCQDYTFQYLDGEVDLSFKKIDEIPMIVETVRELAK